MLLVKLTLSSLNLIDPWVGLSIKDIKLSNVDLYAKDESRKVKDIEKLYTKSDVFESVKDEFEAIAGIVEQSGTWLEVE